MQFQSFLSKHFCALLLGMLLCIAQANADETPTQQPNLLNALGSLFGAGQNRATDEPAHGGIGTFESRNLAVSSADRRVALVIGNATYKSGPLANPVNDAQAIAVSLRKLGFDVILRENLKTREIGGVYREFRSKIIPGGAALVFYAGHGVQFKGENYFPAVDADIHGEEDVPLQSLNLNTLLSNMEEAKAGVSLVFLDACRDNPFARRFRSGTRGLAKVEAASGTLIHYATRPGSVASDGEGRNGTYTEALLTQMAEPGVPVEMMLKRVANRVVQKTDGKQEPWVEGHLRGEFYFIFQGPATVNMQQPTTDPETETWQMAERASTESAYRAYIDAYPQGRYATAAKIALDALKQPAASKTDKPAAQPGATNSSLFDNPETALWAEVKQSGAREYFEAYLNQYPKGKYAALAKVELKKIEDKEKAERARDDADRIAHMARAEAERKALAEKERQEALRAEQDAWDRAKQLDVASGYAGYQESYPNGRYATAANERLAQLKKEESEMRPGKVFKDCEQCPNMVVIPAGSFQMGGDKQNDEQPIHNVTIGRPFALATTEVTQGQWRAVMGSNPSNFSACGDTCPVENVSWDDAQAYVKKLSEKTGKQYRLPSEAEWEYACRAGSRQTYCGSDSIDDVAWYNGNSGGKTHPVADKQANAWGLYDMTGNVWEWVEDCWHGTYNGAPTDGSAWTIGCVEIRRSPRGGSWINKPQVARSAERGSYTPAWRNHLNGFRPARMLP